MSTIPTLPLPNRDRCPACRTTGTVAHEPDSDTCRAIAEERRQSQSDWQRDA